MQRIPERSMHSFPSKNRVKYELEVNEQSENRPSSSYTVIDFVEQSESRLSASISSAKKQITRVSESKNKF